MKLKSKTILFLLKLLKICLSCIMPFIFGLGIFYNMVLHFAFGTKLFVSMLAIPFFLSLIFALYISQMISMYEKQLFIAFCKSKELKPSISNYNWWKLHKWQDYDSIQLVYFEKKMEKNMI